MKWITKIKYYVEKIKRYFDCYSYFDCHKFNQHRKLKFLYTLRLFQYESECKYYEKYRCIWCKTIIFIPTFHSNLRSPIISKGGYNL